eukprot:4208183-Pleurochrysis_carterae.AAC.1
MPNPNYPARDRPSQLSFFSPYYSSQHLVNPAGASGFAGNVPITMMGMFAGAGQNNSYLAAATAAMQ